MEQPPHRRTAQRLDESARAGDRRPRRGAADVAAGREIDRRATPRGVPVNGSACGCGGEVAAVVRHEQRGIRTIGNMKAPALSAVVAMLIVGSVFAAGRERAIRPLPDGLYVASVVDATTLRPVAEAEVTSGTRATKTDARGIF